jgi:hypothetical protein
MAKNELKRLLRRIDDCCESMEGVQDNHVKLMLYFDEAHVLAKETTWGDPYGKDVYDALCSCFNFFLSFPIFVIYIFTDPNNGKLVHLGSARRQGADGLQAPVTETPFDCSPEFPIIPGKLRLEDISKVEFLAQFGRPM